MFYSCRLNSDLEPSKFMWTVVQLVSYEFDKLIVTNLGSNQPKTEKEGYVPRI